MARAPPDIFWAYWAFGTSYAAWLHGVFTAGRFDYGNSSWHTEVGGQKLEGLWAPLCASHCMAWCTGFTSPGHCVLRAAKNVQQEDPPSPSFGAGQPGSLSEPCLEPPSDFCQVVFAREPVTSFCPGGAG